MWEACYFLDVNGLMENERALIREMEALLDQERLFKYREIRAGKAKALSLGAGLLLRYALERWRSCREIGVPGWQELGWQELGWQELGWQGSERQEPMQQEADGKTSGQQKPERQEPCGIRVRSAWELLKDPLMQGLPANPKIAYGAGEAGKPYFEEIPLCFSISHSGTLAAVAVSEREVGLDVQEVSGIAWEKLARRFFAKEAWEELLSLKEKDPEMGRDAFFRKWCCREAAGKLTGEGAMPWLGADERKLSEGMIWQEGELAFGGERYCYAMCRKG